MQAHGPDACEMDRHIMTFPKISSHPVSDILTAHIPVWPFSEEARIIFFLLRLLCGGTAAR
jgi:hypothetical protein